MFQNWNCVGFFALCCIEKSFKIWSQCGFLFFFSYPLLSAFAWWAYCLISNSLAALFACCLWTYSNKYHLPTAQLEELMFRLFAVLLARLVCKFRGIIDIWWLSLIVYFERWALCSLLILQVHTLYFVAWTIKLCNISLFRYPWIRSKWAYYQFPHFVRFLYITISLFDVHKFLSLAKENHISVASMGLWICWQIPNGHTLGLNNPILIVSDTVLIINFMLTNHTCDS